MQPHTGHRDRDWANRHDAGTTQQGGSNVKSDKTLVVIRAGEERIPTGRKKVGAMLGDYVEVGCNSVLNPGTVIGPHSHIYPISSVRGTIPPHHIYKNEREIIAKR